MRDSSITVSLKCGERKDLTEFVSKGQHSALIIRRARIILALDRSGGRKPLPEIRIAELFGVTRQTVQNIKRDWLSLGMGDFLHRKQRESPPIAPKADGQFEAHLIALCCTDPPKGYERWTLRLLADKTVELGYIDSVSPATVFRTLKKTNCSLI